MYVGIIAANLPTLKPLFANFSGHMRTLTKGRSTASRSSPGHSGPFASNGYHKHNGSHAHSGTQDSYAMRDIGVDKEAKKKDSYDDILVLGKEMYGVEVGECRRQSTAGASDESILPHIAPMSPMGQVNAPSGGLGRNLSILKTTEVRVS
jgi:hypothetical protein